MAEATDRPGSTNAHKLTTVTTILVREFLAKALVALGGSASCLVVFKACMRKCTLFPGVKNGVSASYTKKCLLKKNGKWFVIYATHGNKRFCISGRILSADVYHGPLSLYWYTRILTTGKVSSVILKLGGVRRRRSRGLCNLSSLQREIRPEGCNGERNELSLVQKSPQSRIGSCACVGCRLCVPPRSTLSAPAASPPIAGATPTTTTTTTRTRAIVSK